MNQAYCRIAVVAVLLLGGRSVRETFAQTAAVQPGERLMSAVKAMSLAGVRDALQARAPVGTADPDGTTALHLFKKAMGGAPGAVQTSGVARE